MSNCLRPQWTVACQAPLSMGLSRQEYWSGLPFPSPEDLPDLGTEPRSPVLQAWATREVIREATVLPTAMKNPLPFSVLFTHCLFQDCLIALIHRNKDVMYVCTGSILWVCRYLFVHVNGNLSKNLVSKIYGYMVTFLSRIISHFSPVA